GLAITGEVQIHSPRPHMEIQPGKRNVAQMQIPLSRTHIDLQIQGDIFTEAKNPIILRTAEVSGMRILRYAELADAAVDVVIDAWCVESAVVREVRVKHVVGATVDVELTGAHFHPGMRGFRSLQVHGLRGVLRFRIETAAVAETSPVNEKGNQNDDKRNRPSGGADGNSLRRVGVAASIGAIPNLSCCVSIAWEPCVIEFRRKTLEESGNEGIRKDFLDRSG